jgi:hypothetical protein
MPWKGSVLKYFKEIPTFFLERLNVTMKFSTWQAGRFPFRVRNVGIGRRRVDCSIATSGELKNKTTVFIKQVNLEVKLDTCI